MLDIATDIPKPSALVSQLRLPQCKKSGLETYLKVSIQEEINKQALENRGKTVDWWEVCLYFFATGGE